MQNRIDNRDILLSIFNN